MKSTDGARVAAVQDNTDVNRLKEENICLINQSNELADELNKMTAKAENSLQQNDLLRG